MGFWSIPIAVLIFGFLIFIHELGHFLCARAFGVAINEFSVGMGPKIFTKVSKKSGIAYSLRALPIGGYVSMVGEDEESENENAFYKKAAWKRIIITVAGAAMNIILGVILMLVLVLASKTLSSNVIADFTSGALSSRSGLMADDRVVMVGKTPVHTGNELAYEVAYRGAKPLNLTVIRNGEKTVLRDVVFASETNDGLTIGVPDFRVYAESKTLGNILKHTFFRSLSTVKMIWDSIADLVRGKYGIEAVSGPVGTTTVIGEVAAKGARQLLYLVVVITMNLGVMNLLPFPALDGGRLLFLLIECVIRRPIKKEIEGYINFAGLIILFGLMIFVSVKDILGLFK